MCGGLSRTRLIDCERVGRPDLWRGDLGLAEDRLSQQQDAGEEKEKGDKAESSAGCGHGLAPWNYFSVPGGLRCCQWLASLRRCDSCHGSERRAKTNAEDAKVSLRARSVTWGFTLRALRFAFR